jgi:hypothetical protein
MWDVHPTRALYYRRVHFASTGWLKAALLYWEGLWRLVPEGFVPQDPPEVEALIEAGLIENVTPAPYQAVAKGRFVRGLEKLVGPHDELSPSLGRGPTPQRQGRYMLVRAGEIDPGLLKELQAHGLAGAAGEWVAMSSEMAELYMLTLADEVGKHLHAAPATHELLREVAPAYWARKGLVSDVSRATPIDGYAFARSLLPFPALEETQLPIDKLLRARQRYSDERRAFRELVQTQVIAVASLPSVEAIASHLHDFAGELVAETDAQRRDRRASRARDTWRLVGIGAPVSLGAVVTVAGASPVAAALGGVGSLGAGVTDWILGRRQGRPPATRYLLSLEAVLSGARDWARLPEALRR